MASISFSYRSKKPRANIEARFSFKQHNGKYSSQYTRVQVEVSKSFWNEYQAGVNFRDSIKSNRKVELDTQLSKLESFILKEYSNAGNITTGWLKNTVHSFYHAPEEHVIPEDLFGYWSYYLDLRKEEISIRPRTWMKWNGIKNKIERFQNDIGKEYQIREINDSFKKEWVNWCKSEKYAPPTIRKTLSSIKTVCTHAGIKGIETSPEIANLNAGIKGEKAPKIYLSLDEIEKLGQVELSERLDNARDWLIISCYTGQRISDFMKFNATMIRTARGRKFIDLKQVKTGMDVTVPLMPEVEVILKKRNGEFPRPISSPKYNEYIKEVCHLAGIDQPVKGRLRTMVKTNGRYVSRGVDGTYEKWKLIGSHVGRRSFATNCYGLIPTSYLKNITGHSTEVMLLEYIGKTSKDTAPKAYDLLVNSKSNQ